ncbi:MAG: hypothetical protein KJ066_19595 [Acidobacteria bacterium]|nr:hypothetical protein [Acidobacteriota bacterium]
MRLTRDSSEVWAIAAGVALFGYLAWAEAPPWEWTYPQWVQFGSAVFAWLSGRAANSFRFLEPPRAPRPTTSPAGDPGRG